MIVLLAVIFTLFTVLIATRMVLDHKRSMRLAQNDHEYQMQLLRNDLASKTAAPPVYLNADPIPLPKFVTVAEVMRIASVLPPGYGFRAELADGRTIEIERGR
jgi:hypothetical protein